MGIFSGLVKVGRWARQERLGQKIYDALLAPGVYVPQRTEIDRNGNEVVVQPEVVEEQGALRSGTIRWAIAGVTTSITAISVQLKTGIDPETFLLSIGTLVTSLATIWKHVRSWMPVVGAKTPVPRLPE